MDEYQVIQAAIQGDRQAISLIYQQYVQTIYSYVIYRVYDTQVAEDITSDVFVRALETLPSYEQRAIPFVGWLYRIAAGKVVDYFRRSAQRQQHSPLDDDLPDQSDSPEHLVMQALQYDQLQRTLRQLTEEQQEVIRLRFIQGHNLKVTAEIMGRNEGAIKALQFRAIQQLARLMQGEGS